MKRTIPVSDANHRRIADRAYPRSRPGEQVAPHFNDVVGEALDLLDHRDAEIAAMVKRAKEAAEVYAKMSRPPALVCACADGVECSCGGAR